MREGTEVPPRMGAASRTGASLQGQVGGAPSEGTAGMVQEEMVPGRMEVFNLE